MGTILGVASFTLKFALLKFLPGFYSWLYDLLPVKNQMVGTSLLSLALSVGICFAWNFFYDKRRGTKRAIRRKGNELERVISGAFHESKVVSVTMISGKVYIGWVKELPTPSISKYIRVVPLISGYRNDKLEIEFTTHYMPVYAEVIMERQIPNLLDIGTDVVIDIACISNMSFFDLQLYEKFNPIDDEQD